MAQAGNPRAQTQTAVAQPQVGMSQFNQAIGNFGNSMLGGGQPQTQVQMPRPQQAQGQGGKGGAAPPAAQQGKPSGLRQFGQLAMQMPQTQQAQQMPQTQQAQQPNVYQQSAQGLTDAMAGARAGMQYQPMNVYGQRYNAAQSAGTSPITAQQVSSNQLANTSVSPYMNQYTDEVINRTQADIGRQQDIAQNKLGAQASAAGAFGGSRQGVAEGVMAGEYAKLAADTAAMQRQTGFTQAQQAAQSDIANRLQADLANQGAGLTAQQSTAGNTLQTQFANQNALNQAGQYNAGQNLQAQMANQSAGLAGAGTRLGAAGQLGGFANQGFNMGQAINQQQWTQGAAQQALNQQLINSAMGQYQGFTGAPNASLGLPMQALGAANMGQQTQTQSYNPGIFDYLSLGAGLGGSYLNARGMANYGRGWG